MKPERFAQRLEEFEQNVGKTGNLLNVTGPIGEATLLADKQRLHNWHEVCCQKKSDDTTNSIMKSVTLFLRETIEKSIQNILQHGTVVGLRNKSAVPTEQDIFDVLKKTTRDTYADWLKMSAQTTSTIIFENRRYEMRSYETAFSQISRMDAIPALHGYRHVAEAARQILEIASNKENSLLSGTYVDNQLRTNLTLGSTLLKINDLEIHQNPEHAAIFATLYEKKNDEKAKALREAFLRDWVVYDSNQTPPYQLTEEGEIALDYVLQHKLYG